MLTERPTSAWAALWIEAPRSDVAHHAWALNILKKLVRTADR